MTSLITPDWPAPAHVEAGTTTRGIEEDALPRDLHYLNQVHGGEVVAASALREARSPLDADAVVGNSPGDVCAVRTADCVPVLFCAIDGSAIAAAHAGWRGLAAGVIENTVSAMGSASGELLAWLGPAISQANFEVGEEVRDAFLRHDASAGACFEPNERGRWQADIYALTRQRLVAAGVAAIYGGGWCTYAEEERFFSFRRARETGRMVSFVTLK